MSAVDTEHFRTLLLQERERVLAAIQNLHEETPGSIEEETGEVPGIDNHPGDMATATFDRELDLTLEDNSEAVLGEIDEALALIDAGTYGICKTCGKPIPVERLEAMPWATQDIDCKRREERGG